MSGVGDPFGGAMASGDFQYGWMDLGVTRTSRREALFTDWLPATHFSVWRFQHSWGRSLRRYSRLNSHFARRIPRNRHRLAYCLCHSTTLSLVYTTRWRSITTPRTLTVTFLSLTPSSTASLRTLTVTLSAMTPSSTNILSNLVIKATLSVPSRAGDRISPLYSAATLANTMNPSSKARAVRPRAVRVHHSRRTPSPEISYGSTLRLKKQSASVWASSNMMWAHSRASS
ncbi:hypothetical protein K402DRAFT_182995 [Aulographum hederae CBS 113979]|uniref:Uncharacterized protein n=1 Tax=Aulographum hederae CBS 113979 TaxID=1176131 RepID=A0A6G1GQ75_9PEZI|nr:hypothetical protein K402DRAFT_182995 [Aulographum hederae CBS 113979]